MILKQWSFNHFGWIKIENPLAFHELGCYYFKTNNYINAEECFIKGINAGDNRCELTLGSLFYTQKKFKEAFEIFSEHHKNGNKLATKKLAIYYFEDKKYRKIKNFIRGIRSI